MYHRSNRILCPLKIGQIFQPELSQYHTGSLNLVFSSFPLFTVWYCDKSSEGFNAQDKAIFQATVGKKKPVQRVHNESPSYQELVVIN